MIMMGGGGGGRREGGGGGGRGCVFDIGQFITEPDNQFGARLDGLQSFEGVREEDVAAADHVGLRGGVVLLRFGPEEPHPVALSCPEKRSSLAAISEPLIDLAGLLYFYGPAICPLLQS